MSGSALSASVRLSPWERRAPMGRGITTGERAAFTNAAGRALGATRVRPNLSDPRVRTPSKAIGGIKKSPPQRAYACETMESPFARTPESAVRARLSRQELCGEALYELMRRGKLGKETFTARMQALDSCGPDGAIGSCYAVWLLLRAQPESQKRDLRMAQNTMKLREVMRYLESTSKDVDREAASSGSSPTLRTIQPASASS